MRKDLDGKKYISQRNFNRKLRTANSKIKIEATQKLVSLPINWIILLDLWGIELNSFWMYSKEFPSKSRPQFQRSSTVFRSLRKTLAFRRLQNISNDIDISGVGGQFTRISNPFWQTELWKLLNYRQRNVLLQFLSLKHFRQIFLGNYAGVWANS